MSCDSDNSKLSCMKPAKGKNGRRDGRDYGGVYPQQRMDGTAQALLFCRDFTASLLC